MKIYRHGGDYSQLTISYGLEPQPNRLTAAYVDWHSLDGFNRLVNGEVQSAADLISAELAIRAIIFHENVIESRPAVKLYIQKNNAPEIITTSSIKTKDRDFLRELVDRGNFEVSLGNIEHLLAFDPSVDIQKFLDKREKQRTKREQKYKDMGLPEPVFEIDFVNGPLDFVADNLEDFFFQSFSEPTPYIKSFLNPISCSGAASYISHPFLSEELKKYRTYNADQFFEPLDESWRKHMNSLRRALDIEMPPFLSILLSKSADREEIPKVLIALRDEYEDARTRLWELFEEADYIRMGSLKKSVSILNEIEFQAAQIFPNTKEYKFQKKRFLQYDLFGRLASLDILGMMKDLSAFAFKYADKKMAQIDAAYLTSCALEDIDLKHLIANFLTEEELRNLTSNTQGLLPSSRGNYY